MEQVDLWFWSVIIHSINVQEEDEKDICEEIIQGDIAIQNCLDATAAVFSQVRKYVLNFVEEVNNAVAKEMSTQLMKNYNFNI